MSATNTENPGSPYEMEDARQQSPNPFPRHPLPDHLIELNRTPVHIGGESLSPTSAIQLVENLGTNVDAETMHFIAVRLAATLAKREGEYAAQAELFKRQIKE